MAIKRVPTVGVVIIQNNMVLLVKHGEQAGHITGVYGLPAGRVDRDESRTQAAIREVKEEAGLVVREEDLIEIPQRYYADIKRKNGEIMYTDHMVFVAKKFNGKLTASNETYPEWISFEKINALELLPNIEDMIKKAQAYI